MRFPHGWARNPFTHRHELRARVGALPWLGLDRVSLPFPAPFEGLADPPRQGHVRSTMALL